MSLMSMLSGSWFEDLATATHAIPATEVPAGPSTIAMVATIAVAAQSARSEADDAVTWRVSIPPGTSPVTLAKFRAASLALDASILARSLEAQLTPGRGCRPLGEAMNGGESELIKGHQALFSERDLTLDVAEVLADRLVQRDRNANDRRLCLECRHLSGRGTGPRRCGNWHKARVALRAQDAELPRAFIQLPQRCDGFSDREPTTPFWVPGGRPPPYWDGVNSSIEIPGDINGD